MDRLPRLDAGRVVLRQLTDADVPALHAIFSDPRVMRYWSTAPLADPAAAAALLAEIDAGRRADAFYQWGIARADDAVIGTVTLFQLVREHRRAEVGYALGADHWGRGLASAAVARLVRHAFEDLGLHRLEADTDPRNAASLRLLERLGFVREGLLRERWHVGGEVQDAIVLGLLRRAWRAPDAG